MKTSEAARQTVLKKIQKRLQKVIRTYEKVIIKLEAQLEKVKLLEDEDLVTTTLRAGLDQSRKYLEKARDDHQKIVAKQAESQPRQRNLTSNGIAYGAPKKQH